MGWHLYFIVTRDLCRELCFLSRSRIDTDVLWNGGWAAAFINVCVNHPAYFLLSLSLGFSSTSSRCRCRVKSIQLYQCFGTQTMRFTTENEATSNILITLQLITTTQKRERWKRDRESERERKRENDIYCIP